MLKLNRKQVALIQDLSLLRQIEPVGYWGDYGGGIDGCEFVIYDDDNELVLYHVDELKIEKNGFYASIVPSGEETEDANLFYSSLQKKMEAEYIVPVGKQNFGNITYRLSVNGWIDVEIKETGERTMFCCHLSSLGEKRVPKDFVLHVMNEYNDLLKGTLNESEVA